MALEQQVKDLFFDALEIPPAQQEDFLNSRCGDDKALYQEVSGLLNSHQQAPQFLQGLAQNVLGNDWLAEPSQVSPLAPATPSLAPAKDPHDLVGKSLSHYQVIDIIGIGGMGVVYKAHDQRLQRTVALKLLPPFINNDVSARARFIHEARTASTLDHPNIGTIFTIEELDNHQVVIVMAYYQGRTLRQWYREQSAPLQQLLPILRQLAQGLKSAHDHGIVHRDIKPANIMVLPDGSVKVLDFGLAKIHASPLTTTVNAMGTMAYMSPEHIRGEVVDHRTDIWAFGVILYELLSGFKPFDGDNDQAMSQAIMQQPLKLSHLQHIPMELITLLKACLQRDSNQRIASAAEIEVHLIAVTASTVKTSQPSISQRWLKKILLGDIYQHQWLTYGPRSLLASAFILLLIAFVYPIVNKGLIKSSSPPITNPLPKQLHIAVLPIATLDHNNNATVLTDGLLNLVNQSVATLAQSFESMWVVPANKIRQYKINSVSEAAHIFGVNLVLQVDVRQKQQNIVVNLHLTAAADGTVLAQTSLQRTEQRTVILQEDIATALFSLFNLAQNPKIRNNLTQGSTVNAEAFNHFTTASAFMQRKNTAVDIAEAIVHLHQAVAIDNNYVDAYALMAKAYWFQYNASKDLALAKLAEQYSDKALQLDSRNIAAYLILGKIYNGSGRNGLARAIYELALQQAPNNAAVYTGLAIAYKNDKQYDKAEQNYRHAIALTPDYWEYHHYLGAFFLQRGRYQAAVEQFVRVTQLVPQNAMGYNNLAIAHWYLNQVDKAIELFLQALALEKNYSRYNNLASLYYYQQDYQNAAQMYEQALLLNDKDYTVWGSLADSYIWSNRPRALIETTLNKAIEGAQLQNTLLLNDPTVLSNLAAYHAELGHVDKSQALLKQAVNNEPTALEVVFSIGVIYEKLGQRQVALHWLEKALQSGYSLIEVKNHPELSALRKDKRYIELAERFNQTNK